MRIAKNLDLPINAVTQKLAMLGRTGSGKTYAATKLAELMYEEGAQFVTLDPVGVWWGMRLGKDGSKKGGLPIPVFGGLHGDIPIEPTAGILIADLICDKNISAIIDVSQFESDADIARFSTAFANRLFQRRKAEPSAMNLILEEAQTFVPQNALDNWEKKMLHEFHKICKLGRNFGIGVNILSQRPQEVNKKALNQSECLFVFQLTGLHERKAVNDWIKEKGLNEDFIEDITKLQTGYAHIWSPAWLKISSVYKIEEKKTFNASQTPEVGKVQKTQELSPIDLKILSEEIQKTVEKAKENDPELLKKRVAELEKLLEKKPEKEISKEKLDKIKSQIKGQAENELHKLYKPLIAIRDKAIKQYIINSNEISSVVNSLEWPEEIEPYEKIILTDEQLQANELIDAKTFESPALIKNNAHYGDGDVVAGKVYRRTGEGTYTKTDLSLGKGEMKVLVVLGMYGSEGVDREMVTLLTAYKRSSRDAYIQRLQTKGYCSVQNSNIYITQQGIVVLGNNYKPLPTGIELINYWLNKLGGGEQLIFKYLNHNPQGLSRDEISNLTAYKRSSRDAYIQRLTTRRLVVSENGNVKLNPKLYG